MPAKGIVGRSLVARSPRGFWEAALRGPEDRINTRIPHSGSKAQDKVNSRNHGRILL